MKLIEELGFIWADSKKYKARYGMYECPLCKKIYKRQTCSKNSKMCMACGAESQKTHGMSDSILYISFYTIREYCKKKSIENKWGNDFKSFYEFALKNGWKKNLVIDMVYHDKPFDEKNCIFVKRKAPLYKVGKSGYRGVFFHKHANKYRAYIYVNKKPINLKYHSTAKEAAMAYNKYVIDNNINRALNDV